jgi:hypothetical protein
LDQALAHTPLGPVVSTDTMTSKALFDMGKHRIITRYREVGIDARLIDIFGRWEAIVRGAEAAEAEVA